jgi:hypothetical protein
MKKNIIKIWNFINTIFNRFRTNESVFKDIYLKQKWYSEEVKSGFNSGSGLDEKYAVPYVNTITKFIEQHNIKNVVDLGFGDFRVGKRLVDKINLEKYIGIDVVKDVIEHYNKKFKNSKISFQHKSIITDALPISELYLIRQVFQHLSNSDILKALKNIQKKSKIIVTEHQQLNRQNIVPNIDKVRGGYKIE